MADAGFSKDAKRIKALIKSPKWLIITNDDPIPLIHIKVIINELLAKDECKIGTYNNKKYVYHTAWSSLTKALIKINQIRQKNWYWENIS